MTIEAAVSEFVELTKRKKELEQGISKAKDRLKELEHQITTAWEQSGTQSTKMNGMTVFLKRQLWAGYENSKEDLLAALKRDSGTRWMVAETFNSQTLSAFARELETDDDGMPVIPAHLEGALKVTEKFSLGARS